MSELILVHLPLFRLGHLGSPSLSSVLLWRRLLPCNIQPNPYAKFFAKLFFKKATDSFVTKTKKRQKLEVLLPVFCVIRL